jgi:glutathione S-transferase
MTLATPKLELISFKLCPFVQRAVIVLKEKGIDFDLTYIDVYNPPEWFKAISPFGKVPLLKVDDAVLFESAVIMEYLDEAYAPQLHPDNLIDKAQQRGWMEFSSDLLGNTYQMLIAKTESDFDSLYQSMQSKLIRLENTLTASPYYSGETFRLIDAAFAPYFMRISFVAHCKPLGDLFNDTPKVAAWRDALLARESVQTSVVAELGDLYRTNFVMKNDGFICQFL